MDHYKDIHSIIDLFFVNKTLFLESIFESGAHVRILKRPRKTTENTGNDTPIILPTPY